MKVSQIDIDAMTEIFEEHSIEATHDEIKNIVEDYNGYKESCHEMIMYAHTPSKEPKTDPKVEQLEKEIEAYKNYIRSTYKGYGSLGINFDGVRVNVTEYPR